MPYRRYDVLRQSFVDGVVDEGLFPDCLRSLKAVEYVGRDLLTTNIRVKEISVQVNVYRMINSPEDLESSGTLLQGEVIELPNARFDGLWQG
jgi:hypothetical protein